MNSIYTMEAKMGKTIAILLARLGGETVITKEEAEKFSISELNRRGGDLLSLPEADGSVRVAITFERD
jgi:hypothetical protein